MLEGHQPPHPLGEVVTDEFAFPLPSSVAAIPGAEALDDMYPYFTKFQPQDDRRFWFYNAMHFPEPLPAFDAITAEIPYTAIGANTARLFVFPTTLGIEHRILNGRVYITANPVLDDGEIAARLELFQQRAGHYYEHWDEIYAQWKERMAALIQAIEALAPPELGEVDDLAVVTEARGIASNHYVRERYHEAIDLFSKMWHHHTELLMLGYGAYLVFFEFLKGAFPEIPDQTVSRMVAGIDVIMYRPDEELKRLARLAVRSGLADLFADGATPESVRTGMSQRGAAGAAWLAEYAVSADPWFRVSTGDGFYHHHRSWQDDPTVPFAALPRYVQQLLAGESLERPIERLRQERDRIAQDYRALLGSPDEQAAFDQMLGLCRTVFPYVEDHKFYCEHWFATAFFDTIRAFGGLLARFGIVEDPEDIFHLHHTEADQALAEVQLVWASGGTAVGGAHFVPIVAERKRMLELAAGWSPPPALGPVPPGFSDPALQMLWGISFETVKQWSSSTEMQDNQLRGYAASPGVVEGRARVLLSVNEIGTIQQGDILVCPVTAPSWGPVFGKITAAVSDIGGTMSHAAIVAREYGMPAVVGTGQATKHIRTGDLVRVDGDRGVVTVLDAG